MSDSASEVELIQRFRTAMSDLVAGVAAVTVDDRGAARGMLATSVSSYSDHPPSVLVSMAHTSRTRDPLLRSHSFGVHLLGREQTDVASAFAGRSNDKFAGVSWSWDRGVPRLASVLGFLRCRRSATFEHHDHTIVIGDVESVELADSPPMVYFRHAMDWRLDQKFAPRAQWK